MLILLYPYTPLSLLGAVCLSEFNRQPLFDPRLSGCFGIRLSNSANFFVTAFWKALTESDSLFRTFRT